MMNRKRIIIIAALLAFTLKGLTVTVETTASLNEYYPEFTRIDLVCGQMPKVTQKDVEFCCEAAFTGELLDVFRHSNIADNHICSGVMKKGYRCKANSGDFVWRKGINPKFTPCDNAHDTNQLPNSWCWTTLGSLFQHNTGKALIVSVVNRRPMVRMSHLSELTSSS